MPEGTKVIAAEAYGYLAWTITGKVSALSPDGTFKKSFIKFSTP